jgi:uncharacterized protein YukE
VHHNWKGSHRTADCNDEPRHRAAQAQRGGRSRGARHAAALLLALIAVLLLAGAALSAGAYASPGNVSPPTISGAARDGSVLKAAKGKWTPKPTSYSYEWTRCDGSGGGCSPIHGATQHAYRATSLDVGHTVRVVVTASGGEGGSSAASAATPVVAIAPPARGKAPAISGVPRDGALLTAGGGTWKGTTPFTFSYQWQSCAGRVCSPIAGATGSSYRATTPEIGRKLRVVVTATNTAGSASTTSQATKKIVPGPSVNIGAPSISGLPIDGQTLTATSGEWAGTAPITYTYQWISCSSLTGECTPIPGSTSSTYEAGPLDVTNSLEVEVTATNAIGSTSATSAATSLIGAIVPANTGLPSISGLLEDGKLLTAAIGGWTGTEPISYAYQWLQCNGTGEACEDISGATGTTLGLISSLVGSTVRVIVTATNSGGSTEATSAATGLIGALLPSNKELPSISGLLKDGESLSAAVGSWTGTEPITYAYQWQQCNAKGEACKNLEDATASTLGLVSTLVGSTVRVIVTATNAGGSTEATSAATGLIAALLPSNTELPSIGGLAEDGQTLKGATGAWSGTTPIAYSYQWQQCNAAGAECKSLTGETKETLALSSSLVKATLRLLVTATNSGGSTQATSAATSPVLAALALNTVQPTISGILKLGEKLLAHPETWSGTAPITYTYQWQLCGVLGLVGECKDIAGATKENFLLELLDVGLTLRVGVTAHNERGASATVYSKVTGLIQGLGLSPTKGAAGTNVVLKGAGVDAAKTVNFGGTQVEPEVVSPTEVVAEAPPGSGTVPVTLSTTEGTTHETPSDRFTYSP